MDSSMGTLFVLGLLGVAAVAVWALIAVVTTRGKPRVSRSRDLGAKATGSLAAGMLMVSVVLPWGSSPTLRITANYLTFVLGALVALSVSIAGVGRTRSRALLAAAGVATALVATVDVVARLGNVGDVRDLGASVGIGLWLALAGGILGIVSGALSVISALLPPIRPTVGPKAPAPTAAADPWPPEHMPSAPTGAGSSAGLPQASGGGGVSVLTAPAPVREAATAPPAPPPVFHTVGMSAGVKAMIALTVIFFVIAVAAFALSFLANNGNAKTFADEYAALRGADPAVSAISLESGTRGFVSALTAYRTATQEAIRLQNQVTDMFDRAVARYEGGNREGAKELVRGKGARLIASFREAVRAQRTAGDSVRTAYQHLQEVLP